LEADESLQKAIEETLRIDVELKRLREENRQLKMERDILKKAAALFAKENY